MNRFLLSLIILAFATTIILAGCASRTQQQHAADAIAAQEAIVQIQQPIATNPSGDPIAVKAAQDTVAIATATIPRIEQSMETPRADLPLPTISAAAIAGNPQPYTASTPPSPPAGGLGAAALSGLIAVGLGSLYALKQAAPLIPGGGTAVGMVADLAWNVLAHKDQKAADDAVTRTAGAAQLVAPVLLTLSKSPDLPAALKAKLTPDILAAAFQIADPSLPTAPAKAA